MEAMRRSASWYANEAAKHERTLQRIVWPNGAPIQSAPQRSAARALYPNHPSFRQSEIVRGDAPQGSIASRMYGHLLRKENK